MLIEEAKWFGKQLKGMDGQTVFPMLNIGSSTGFFRTQVQPWIDEYIFELARKREQIVIHLDMKPEEGVDIVGDLADDAFLLQVQNLKFRSVFCSNLLEHVENREEVCRLVSAVIPIGGFIFVSCPKSYPFHPDPIDTLFRPNIDELINLFPGTRIFQAAIVADETYKQRLKRQGVSMTKTIIRLLLPFYKLSDWKYKARMVPWMFNPFTATCAILIKTE